MKLMDKFKNLFTDEEEFEDEEEEIEEPVKIKEIKKEEPKKDKLPTFMREKIAKEEKESKKEEIPDFKINEETVPLSSDVVKDVVDSKSDSIDKFDSSFKFPIEFDENDFTDVSRVSRQNRNNKVDNMTSLGHKDSIHRASPKNQSKKEVKVAELYKDKKEESKEDIKRFQATPIISPIYGVLNKNYHKDEIETRGDNYEINRPSKNLDFDSVRKKAYGSTGKLEEDIKNNLVCENCDYYKSANTCNKNLDNNLMYDALCEKDDDISLDEAIENYYDYGVEYEKNVDIDSYSDESDEDVRIVNHEEEVPKKQEVKKKNEIPPVKSSINLLSTLKKSMGDDDDSNDENEGKNLELTDDLFNLIDSMYDEGNEK